jgi:hypothetical protein
MIDILSAIVGGLIGWGMRATLPLLIAEVYAAWKQRHGQAT